MIRRPIADCWLTFLCLVLLPSALLLGCAPTMQKPEEGPKASVSGVLNVGAESTTFTHIYAAQMTDRQNPEKEYLVVLVADRPVDEADRMPKRLTALARKDQVRAIRLLLRLGYDDVRIALYHPHIDESGKALQGHARLNITAMDDDHVEAEVQSKKLSQGWDFSFSFRADLAKGGATELEPLSTSTPSKPQHEGKAKKQPKKSAASSPVEELARLGREYTEEDFIHAIQEGDVRSVRLFLKGGMSPDTKSSGGDSALLLASMLCNEKPAKGHNEIVLALIGAKAKLNSGAPAAPLIWAAQHCSAKVVKAFIDAGADVNIRAKGGATPLMMAEFAGRKENAALLRQAGGER